MTTAIRDPEVVESPLPLGGIVVRSIVLEPIVNIESNSSPLVRGGRENM